MNIFPISGESCNRQKYKEYTISLIPPYSRLDVTHNEKISIIKGSVQVILHNQMKVFTVAGSSTLALTQAVTLAQLFIQIAKYIMIPMLIIIMLGKLLHAVKVM